MHWSFWRCSSNKGTVSQEESAIPAATESLLCTLRMNHETGFIFFSDSPSKLTIFLIVVLPFYSDCRILLWLACHFGVRNWASAFSSIYVTYVASNTKRRKYSQCERVIFRMVQSTVGSVEKGMHTGLYTLLLNNIFHFLFI